MGRTGSARAGAGAPARGPDLRRGDRQLPPVVARQPAPVPACLGGSGARHPVRGHAAASAAAVRRPVESAAALGAGARARWGCCRRLFARRQATLATQRHRHAGGPLGRGRALQRLEVHSEGAVTVLEHRPCACRARGFTLLELLVVVLIIGLLTAIVAPRFLGQVSKSEVVAARAQLDMFDKALHAYRLDAGRFPSSAQGLRALVSQPTDEPRWRGPYLQGDVPLDPWGSPYQYRAPGSAGHEFELLSLGRDRAAGGSGDDADIVR
ncbi:MAG: type II secretion system major pseudopilin GspG [Rhodoferax sp.]|nr:type II secretion system major pseudopilin GspG [Rhodoferax sp.]